VSVCGRSLASCPYCLGGSREVLRTEIKGLKRYSISICHKFCSSFCGDPSNQIASLLISRRVLDHLQCIALYLTLQYISLFSTLKKNIFRIILFLFYILISFSYIIYNLTPYIIDLQNSHKI